MCVVCVCVNVCVRVCMCTVLESTDVDQTNVPALSF